MIMMFIIMMTMMMMMKMVKMIMMFIIMMAMIMTMMMMIMLMIVVIMMIRMNSHLECPEMWKAMQRKFDQVLLETYEGGSIPALNFLIRYRRHLLLFISAEDFKILHESLQLEATPLEMCLSGLRLSRAA